MYPRPTPEVWALIWAPTVSSPSLGVVGSMGHGPLAPTWYLVGIYEDVQLRGPCEEPMVSTAELGAVEGLSNLPQNSIGNDAGLYLIGFVSLLGGAHERWGERS